MLKLEISEPAKGDIKAILEKTHYEYGEEGAFRYAKLIYTALEALSVDKDTFGVGKTLRGHFSYHLKRSKKQAIHKKRIIKNPPHLIFFKVEGNILNITRILHEAMQHQDHL